MRMIWKGKAKRGLLAGAALVLGGAARAQGPVPGSGTSGDSMGNMGTTVHHESGGLHGANRSASVPGGSAVEVKKQLTEIDVDLKDAINRTKVLYEGGKLEPGRFDEAIRTEGLGNIDRAVSGALSRIGQLRSLPDARMTDTRTLSRLERDLGRARGIVAELRASQAASDRVQLQQQSSRLFSVLRSADDDFSRLAEETSLTRVDQVSVPERQPVSGSDRDDDRKPDIDY